MLRSLGTFLVQRLLSILVLLAMSEISSAAEPRTTLTRKPRPSPGWRSRASARSTRTSPSTSSTAPPTSRARRPSTRRSTAAYDWHSSVHGHWMLVRLLRCFPDLPEAEEIRAVLAEHLTAENLQAEADYFARKPNRQSFERPYGWAWLLKLAEELHGWDDPDAKAVVARTCSRWPT